MLCANARGQYSEYDTWDKNYAVQALLGAMKFDDLEFEVEDGQKEEADLSTIPQLGGAWGTLPKGDRFQYGLECSFLMGFRVKDLEYLVINSGLRAEVSVSLWTFDLAGGPYASLFLDKGKKVRLYGGAGPLMMYADYNSDKDLSDDTTDDEDESAFGVGVYARAGLEIRMYKYGMLGMGVRSIYADIDFNEVKGTSDVRGIAAFVTFTAGF
jgi:hypothetical protein